MSLTPDHPTPPADAAPVATETLDPEAVAPVEAVGATPTAEAVADLPAGIDTPASHLPTSAPEAVAADAVVQADVAAEPAADGAATVDPAAPTAPVPAAEIVESSVDATAAAPAAAARAPEMSLAACADLLKQHFPALFGGAAKPLKLRIQADIKERAPGVFSKAALSAFFRRYTGSTGYLIALSKAEHRFDLDGQPAGELSDEHRQLAQEELTRRRQLTREREQQARAAQRTQAPQQARAEGAAEGTPDTRPDQPARPPRPPRQRPDRPQQRSAPGAARPSQDRPGQSSAGRGPGPRPDHRPDDRPGNRAASRPDPRADQRAAPPMAPSALHTNHANRPAEPAAHAAADAAAHAAAPAPMSAEALAALQARQARHALLRDFDRTPLTLANFCALKGLKPDTLAPMLELARKEAAAMPRAPMPPMDDRRGPSGAPRDVRNDSRNDRRPGTPGDRPRPAQDARGGPRPEQRRPRGPAGQS